MAINNPDSSVQDIAKAVGAYLHPFQDTFAHRDENNVPYDPVKRLFGIPLGFGHVWDKSNPDYTNNHPGRTLIGLPKQWTVNESRNLEMDKQVYDRMQLIAAMLQSRGVTLGTVTPWVEAPVSGLDGPDGDGDIRDVRSAMKAFNKLPETEEKGVAEHRDATDFPNKRKLLDRALRAWGYYRTDPDGSRRPYELGGRDAYRYTPESPAQKPPI